MAVLVDYAQFVAPRGDALHLSGEQSQVLIQLLDWASDPALTGAFVTTVLITENLADLHVALVESPYNAEVQVPLPTAAELAAFVRALTAGEPNFDRLSDSTATASPCGWSG